MSIRRIFSYVVGVMVGCATLFAYEAGSTELSFVTTELPPFNYTENGEIIGMSTDLVRQIFSQMGYAVKIKVFPAVRALTMLEAGEVTGVFSFTQTPERLAFVYYSNPVATGGDGIFKRKQDPIRWENLTDLAPYRFGAIAGYNYGEEFRQAVEQKVLTVEYVYGENAGVQNLRKLKAGYIDLFVCGIPVCSFLIKQYAPEFEAIDYIDKYMGRVVSLHVGFSKKWPGSKELRDEFNRYLDEFIARGQVQQIYEKYGVRMDREQLGSKGSYFLLETAD